MKKRKRRKGSVRWREDTHKYVIDYRDNLGRRHVETIGTNWHQANRILDQRMNQIHTGTFNPVMNEMSFQDYAEKWFRRKVQIKEATRTSYRGILDNHLIPYFGDAKISDIQRSNIQDLVKIKVDQGRLSSKTIHNILVTLHQIMIEAEVDGLIIRNPYLKIARPKPDQPEQDYLRMNEIPIFLENCEPKNYALFYTAVFTGMRRGELLGLKWGDIDWANNRIHVKRSLYKGCLQTPKSKYSLRAIDMGPRLTQVLREHRIKQNMLRLKAGVEWSDNDLVFCNETGSFLDADNLYHRDFKRILKKAGLRQLRIHDLRHTFASILIAAGHTPKYIQNQMGHGSIQITMDLYGHLMKEVHEGAAKKSEDFVFNRRHQTSEEVIQKGTSIDDFGYVTVTENKNGVTNESQPLDLFGSGG